MRELEAKPMAAAAIACRTTEGGAIANLARIRAELSEVNGVDEAARLVDQAEAIRVLTSKAKMNLEIQNEAAETKLRCERRAGELIATTHRAGRGRPKMLHDETFLSDLGIERVKSHRWQTMAALPADEFEQHISKAKEAGRELTSVGVYRLGKQYTAKSAPAEPQPTVTGVVGSLSELDGQRFATVYADPPWQYGNQGTRASTDNHYGTMTVEQICAEPVKDLVEENAHLHLWTTNAFLFDAKTVMEAWGFEYKSCFVWVKPQMGIGNYWRLSHEFMLFGIRGKAPFRDRSLMSWAQLDRTKHSAKPEQVRDFVMRASPGPYLELYGRSPVDGWTVYGNQIERRLFAK